jgi:hypothetical protein
VVIAAFDQVISDFGGAIRTVNRRFDTLFTEFEHTDVNVERCFELIERRNRERYGVISEPTVARPSAQRDALKDALRQAYEVDRLARLRARAARVYKALVSSPSVP